MLDRFRTLLGEAHVLTGRDLDPYRQDWTGAYRWDPLALLRPETARQVSEIMKIASASETAVVPVSGNTGLTGGTRAEGALMLSLERMTEIREIRSQARTAIVEAGVILSELHAAAEQQDLVFPLTFGAKGSARIGGCLATNAGGSNVLRYGNTRDLCLGIEVVLADGRIVNLMSELHKDNSGLNLRHLMIGSEGTLGIITAAVLKLVPKPKAYATAMVAMSSLDAALTLLNHLQSETGNAVEAFEYMPRRYIEAHLDKFPDAREPFDAPHEVNILVEVGALSDRDAAPDDTGQIPSVAHLERILTELFETGMVLDATVARTEAQRSEMWARREAAAEIALSRKPIINNDIAVPLDKVEAFLDRMAKRLPALDRAASDITVAHLGDGNVHYTVWPGSDDPDMADAVMEAVEDEAIALGGSFSAEHGVGLSKLSSMRRRKDPVALDVMRAIKVALDPKGLLNPGKLVPDDRQGD